MLPEQLCQARSARQAATAGKQRTVDGAPRIARRQDGAVWGVRVGPLSMCLKVGVRPSQDLFLRQHTPQPRSDAPALCQKPRQGTARRQPAMTAPKRGVDNLPGIGCPRNRTRAGGRPLPMLGMVGVNPPKNLLLSESASLVNSVPIETGQNSRSRDRKTEASE